MPRFATESRDLALGVVKAAASASLWFMTGRQQTPSPAAIRLSVR